MGPGCIGDDLKPGALVIDLQRIRKEKPLFSDCVSHCTYIVTSDGKYRTWLCHKVNVSRLKLLLVRITFPRLCATQATRTFMETLG